MGESKLYFYKIIPGSKIIVSIYRKRQHFTQYNKNNGPDRKEKNLTLTVHLVRNCGSLTESHLQEKSKP